MDLMALKNIFYSCGSQRNAQLLALFSPTNCPASDEGLLKCLALEVLEAIPFGG